MARLKIAFKTERSKDSSNEKDSFFCKDNLFVVAEGVSGDYLGDVAKEKACSGLASSFFRHLSKERVPGTALESALREVNEEILKERKRLGRKMVASVSVSYVTGKIMYFSHLGDSRIYCLHKGEIVQLTKDHTVGEENSLIEMGAVDPRVLRALTDGLGVREAPDIKVKTYALREGDIILLTTEGLTRYLSNMQILKLSLKATSPRRLSLRLIEEAKRKGARDSMTVGLIRYEHFPQFFQSKRAVAGLLFGLLILAALGTYGVRHGLRIPSPEEERPGEAQVPPKKAAKQPVKSKRQETPPQPRTPAKTVEPARDSSRTGTKTAEPAKEAPHAPAKAVETAKGPPSKGAAVSLEQEIAGFLGGWKTAWEQAAGEKGDMGRYMSFYAEDFASQGLDKNAWRKEKTGINRKKAWIRIELRDIAFEESGRGDLLDVHFLQDYKSSNFLSSSKKTLGLRRAGSGWKIVREKAG